jgi:esterase
MDQEALAHLQRVAGLAGVETRAVRLPVSRHAVLGGRRFHYLAWGDESAPPVLFLHGGNQSAHTWDVVCLALSERYHCVALDQRGHGDSEWSYELDYRAAAHALDIERLADHLGWSKFTIVGMSMGCMNALQFAGTRPERLTGFVAVDAGPYVEIEGGQQIIDFVEGNRSHATLDGFVAAAMRFNTRRAPELLRHSLRHTVRQMADGTFQWRADRRQSVKVEDMVESLQGMRELVPHIACPALVVRGAESKVFSHDGMLRFARELPNGAHITIPDAGHTVQGDNPKALIEALEGFLETLPSYSARTP